MRPHLLLVIAIPLLGTSDLHGQTTPASAAAIATERLMRAYLRDQGVPGAAVAIVVDDSLVYVRGFGWANLEDSVPVTARTLFPTASTLKLLTATAVLQLAERKSLALDDPIQRYCPRYPAKPLPVTIRDLLVHQGGVRPSTGPEVFNRVHYSSVKAAVSAFAEDSLVAPPGTKQVYSNAGYVLLACAIEGASKQDFTEYLRGHVLGPAGMMGTQPADIYRIIPRRAGAYMVRTAANTRAWTGLWLPAHLDDTELDVPFRADPLDESFATGASNFLTTPAELARFVIALDQGRLLGREQREAMFEDHPTADGQPTGRGYAWMVTRSGDAVTARLAGSVWTGSSAVLYLPQRHFVAVVSTNLGFQQPHALLDSLAASWEEKVRQGGAR
jgi:CubicO group peptidase (beta-lactamase class C family)